MQNISDRVSKNQKNTFFFKTPYSYENSCKKLNFGQTQMF